MPGTHLNGALRVLSLNIRATQGGAGRVGYDLHHRLRAAGHHSRLLYGYGSGIAPDPQIAGEPDVEMIGSRPVVLANYAAHLLLGHEVATARRHKVRDAIAQADVVHLHAAHHWYLHWESLARMLGDSGKPVVITAHDWWLLTGPAASWATARGGSGPVANAGRAGSRTFPRCWTGRGLSGRVGNAPCGLWRAG
jgi:putative colanic acid biosynthesis glycosyltransferase